MFEPLTGKGDRFDQYVHRFQRGGLQLGANPTYIVLRQITRNENGDLVLDCEDGKTYYLRKNIWSFRQTSSHIFHFVKLSQQLSTVENDLPELVCNLSMQE